MKKDNGMFSATKDNGTFSATKDNRMFSAVQDNRMFRPEKDNKPLRIEILQANTLDKYDKFIGEIGEYIIQSDYSEHCKDEMVETFYPMDLKYKIWFEDDKFKFKYFDSFNQLYLFISSNYSSDVRSVFFNLFKQKQVDIQLEYMKNEYLRPK